MPSRARTIKKQKPQKRQSAAKRGYDRKWRKVRERKLWSDPLCVDCLIKGISTQAVDVHHIVKIADRPDLRLEPSNLMSLCKSCHARRTSRGE